MTAWLRDAAPTGDLRRWFGHDSRKWDEFQRRYCAELASKPQTLQPIIDAIRQENVTLLYSAHDEEHNSAVALQGYLQRQLALP